MHSSTIQWVQPPARNFSGLTIHTLHPCPTHKHNTQVLCKKSHLVQLDTASSLSVRKEPRFSWALHAPLKRLRLGTQKSRRGKIQTLGQSVCYKLLAAASYFASSKYSMLQEKLLLFTLSLSLSHAHTHTRTPSWLCSDVNRRGKLLPDLSSDQFTPWSMRLVSF